MVCGIPDAGGRKLRCAGGRSNSSICEACDSGQGYRQTATGKLIANAHLKELQPSMRSSTLSNTHLSLSLFPLLKCFPIVVPYRDLTTARDVPEAVGFIFATNGRRYIPTVLVATSNSFQLEDL